jgi:hypothetical protein
MPAGGDPRTRLFELAGVLYAWNPPIESSASSSFAEDRHFLSFYPHCATLPGLDWPDQRPGPCITEAVSVLLPLYRLSVLLLRRTVVRDNSDTPRALMAYWQLGAIARTFALNKTTKFIVILGPTQPLYEPLACKGNPLGN